MWIRSAIRTLMFAALQRLLIEVLCDDCHCWSVHDVSREVHCWRIYIKEQMPANDSVCSASHFLTGLRRREAGVLAVANVCSKLPHPMPAAAASSGWWRDSPGAWENAEEIGSQRGRLRLLCHSGDAQRLYSLSRARDPGKGSEKLLQD